MSKPTPGQFDDAIFITISNVNAGCVQIAIEGAFVAIRDSTLVSSPTLVFNSAEWQAFTDAVKRGELDISDSMLS